MCRGLFSSPSASTAAASPSCCPATVPGKASPAESAGAARPAAAAAGAAAGDAAKAAAARAASTAASSTILPASTARGEAPQGADCRPPGCAASQSPSAHDASTRGILALMFACARLSATALLSEARNRSAAPPWSRASRGARSAGSAGPRAGDPSGRSGECGADAVRGLAAAGWSVGAGTGGTGLGADRFAGGAGALGRRAGEEAAFLRGRVAWLPLPGPAADAADAVAAVAVAVAVAPDPDPDPAGEAGAAAGPAGPGGPPILAPSSAASAAGGVTGDESRAPSVQSSRSVCSCAAPTAARTSAVPSRPSGLRPTSSSHRSAAAGRAPLRATAVAMPSLLPARHRHLKGASLRSSLASASAVEASDSPHSLRSRSLSSLPAGPASRPSSACTRPA